MKTITRDELKALFDQGDAVHLINVLSEESFRNAHIPGSLNIPLDDPDFEKKVAQACGSKAQRIVVYCASTECNASRTAVQRLELAGFYQTSAYEGGVKDWKEAGFALEGEGI